MLWRTGCEDLDKGVVVRAETLLSSFVDVLSILLSNHLIDDRGLLSDTLMTSFPANNWTKKAGKVP